MKPDTEIWLKYADENYQSAIILMESDIYGTCLQNFQQSIEKYLKACLIEAGCNFEKTHSIQKLISLLKQQKISVTINQDDIEYIDSIYMPSKYPFSSALPHFEATLKDCEKSRIISENIRNEVLEVIT